MSHGRSPDDLFTFSDWLPVDAPFVLRNLLSRNKLRIGARYQATSEQFEVSWDDGETSGVIAAQTPLLFETVSRLAAGESGYVLDKNRLYVFSQLTGTLHLAAYRARLNENTLTIYGMPQAMRDRLFEIPVDLLGTNYEDTKESLLFEYKPASLWLVFD